jgi:hypothetical protein
VKWRTAHNGIVAIPGNESGLPCPIVLEYEGSPHTGQTSKATLINATDVRLYIAGHSNIAWPDGFLGVLEQLAIAGDRIEIQLTFPWILWVLPESYISPINQWLRSKHLAEAVPLGLDEWREKWAQWGKQEMFKNAQKFAPEKKPPVKKRTIRRMSKD